MKPIDEKDVINVMMTEDFGYYQDASGIKEFTEADRREMMRNLDLFRQVVNGELLEDTENKISPASLAEPTSP